MCLCSLLFSCLLVVYLLPLFNDIANSNLSVKVLFQPGSVIAMLALILLISLFAGWYPAVFLSGFKTTDIFRNVIKSGKGKWLRKSLITTQFALSVILIVATVVVNKQVRYLAGKDLGFNKEQVIVLPVANTNLANNRFIH